MGSPQVLPRLTEAEYLAGEREAPLKSEFFDGETFAMAGGTEAHSLTAANLVGELREALAGSGCRTYTCDLRVKVDATGLLTYPDASVACGERRFLDDEADTLLNPVLIAEVLSDSTEAYDRGEKFRHYRLIPSLQSYLLLSQRQPLVEQFLRTDAGVWTLATAEGLGASLAIPPLRITLALSGLYRDVVFTPQKHPPTRLPTG